MEAKHTPGLLRWMNENTLVIDEGHRPVVLTGGRSPGTLVERKADGRLGPLDPAGPNAAHLVACWNACDGLSPEAVPDLLAACEALAEFWTHGTSVAAGSHAALDMLAALARARGER